MIGTPLTIVGGFLGAGKTTLLNHLLRSAEGRRLALLVNDFGAVNIDADLIEARENDAVRLSNGCVCCSIGDSLIDALIGVLRRPVPPDHVVIEASGVADPGRIAEIAYLDPAVALQGVIVVADAQDVRRLARDKYVGDTVRRQIEAADIVVMNKVDLLGGSSDDSAAWLQAQAPQARVVPASYARLPIEVLLGLDQDHWGGFLRAGPASAHRPAQMFTACVFEADEPFRCEALTDCIESLPSSVLRVKGIVVTDDNPGQPQTLQIVGRRWELAPVAASLRPLPARTRLVAVGLVGLDDADLRRRLTGALAP